MSKAGMIAAVLGVCVATASSAHAESRNLSITYTNCMDNAGGVTAEMHGCIGAEHEKQDKRLNAAYKAAMKTVEGKRAQDFKEVQRAWLKFRDLNCGFAGGGEGTIAGILGASCVLNMTAERADELQAIAEAP
ncbi:Uncharacterized conserved protein YecT, DUF1311 family [Azospirillum lipoferum]|nr:Uncharacterized conserved protein YecT, DUF1311 family [Azospirillum lipoferum]